MHVSRLLLMPCMSGIFALMVTQGCVAEGVRLSGRVVIGITGKNKSVLADTFSFFSYTREDIFLPLSKGGNVANTTCSIGSLVYDSAVTFLFFALYGKNNGRRV